MARRRRNAAGDSTERERVVRRGTSRVWMCMARFVNVYREKREKSVVF